MKDTKIGLNRITLPGYSLVDFAGFAAGNGFSGIELRNDLPGKGIADGEAPARVAGICRKLGLEIISINALQRFNEGAERLPALLDELAGLLEMASALGCIGIVLCPLNDADDSRSETERREDTVRALKAFGPLFEKYKVKGWIEPLGFPQCSLRFKEDAVAAIELSGFASAYGLVHDTFHHYLSGETRMFPEYTGLVHISGVEGAKPAADITDDDRVLITSSDIMANEAQIRGLMKGNFSGYFSFECFSPGVRPEQIPISRNYLFSGGRHT